MIKRHKHIWFAIDWFVAPAAFFDQRIYNIYGYRPSDHIQINKCEKCQLMQEYVNGHLTRSGYFAVPFNMV